MLRPAVACDTVETTAFGPVDQVVVTATHDPETGDLAVFVVNRSRTEPAELALDVAAVVEGAPTAYALVEHLQLHDDDTSTTNTEAQPDRVVPRPGDATVDGADGTTLAATLRPTPWHCIGLTEGTVQ